ncbi:MAG: IPT/TIG domain-containing protein [Actinomycetota bacterium]|nr:IPT/TIG domain-containing protein [Actinomycetota bacterium]
MPQGKTARIGSMFFLLLVGIVTLGGTPAQAKPHPSISGFSPTSGLAGTRVLISGQDFQGTNSVSFNGIRSTSINVISHTKVRATVPSDATTGPIRLVRGNQTVASTSNFVVQASSADLWADLWLEVDASADPIVAGSVLTYTLSVNNAGPDPADGTTLVDSLPADVIFTSASDGGTYDAGTGEVTWNVGTVDAGASATRHLDVRPIHPEYPMSNSVSATTSSTDPGSPNSDSVDTTVNPEAGVHYISVRDAGVTPSFHEVALGETVQWDFFGPSAHEITDSHGLGLFDTGLRSPIDMYRFTFNQSAEIRTKDLDAFPLNTGKLVVPVEVTPASGSQTATFLVTWALAQPPAGIVDDVQIKRPGGAWVPWVRGETTTLQAPFAPDAGPGTYSFRSRIRNVTNGTRSRFGSPVPIAVS